MRRTLGVLVVVMALAGCGSEVGRVPFSGEGQRESTVTLAPGEVAFWTDIDISYEGQASLQYEIELSQDGAMVARATCDPLGYMTIKTGWVQTNINDRHSRSGRGKMGCSATVPAGGPTLVKAGLVFAEKPPKLSLTKADLVLKQ